MISKYSPTAKCHTVFAEGNKAHKEVIQRKPFAEESATFILPSVLSLFCGAGGLDWGFHREGYKIVLAIDCSQAAIRTYRRNFPFSNSVAADLLDLGPEGVCSLLKEELPSGSRIGVIGGPPCQGFSRANTGSRSDDPRNQLPALYLEIVRRLQEEYVVEFALLENVLGIRDKKHFAIYSAFVRGLANLGFVITEKELCAIDFGVPQTRRRIVLSALRSGQGYGPVVPEGINGLRTVRDAIGGLCEPAYFTRNLRPEDIPLHPNHWTMQPKSPRFRTQVPYRANSRSFKRLYWDEPCPTIAFGNREIHVHPNGRRRISIYEAMLLQGFSKNFVLEGNFSEQVEQVSNAVPPPLGRALAKALLCSLREAVDDAA